ncbi:GPI16 [Candida pseudojiufengensis]|uniref:GPI16 n=1 Tax=Candida pseudojiufengensis TaxID=497109 RepID=UPI002224F41B|nr:GPI16 [Candida pseudojiufengensis]KAI5965573.1 GPI16 [Candida pseudojiufengensis]
MRLLARAICTVLWIKFILANESYHESLDLKPLPRNKLLTGFNFHTESSPFQILKDADINDSTTSKISHYTLFPNTLGPILESTDTRELSLKFTQGWWDSQSWGKLPHDGFFSGGTGVEVVAVIEASNVLDAKQKWSKLTKILSGFFCASLNSINDEITTFPKYAVENVNIENYRARLGNKLFIFRASLPSEPVCTENLTPFIKLLPTRGKAGISSLLDGHKLFDSLWHGMSVDVTTVCDDENNCKLKLHQTINQVIDVIRSIRKKAEGNIPKPVSGDKLRCDQNKTQNIWQCFPLNDPTNLEWSLATLFGRNIKGPAFEDDPEVTRVNVEFNPSSWQIEMQRDNPTTIITNSLNTHGTIKASEVINEQYSYDFKFVSTDSNDVVPIQAPPLQVSRSLMGYSLDNGGLRSAFTNPSDKEVDFIYFESLPWFMRLYLSSLELTLKNSTGSFSVTDQSKYIKQSYYRPSSDRERPSHMELVMSVPPNSTLAMTYEFDKSLLLYREYPPDANHGFDVEPAVIIVKDKNDSKIYEFRTTSLLLTLPTPDFSMPYNVIILTCTVLSLAFGVVFNLLTKKTVTEEEFEQVSQNSNFAKLKTLVLSKILRKTKID